MKLHKLSVILLALLSLGVIWMLFLFSAQLLLDFEERKDLFVFGYNAIANFFYKQPQLGESFDYVTQSQNLRLTEDTCIVPDNDRYPNCWNEYNWLKQNWYKKPCYKEFDIDGSSCSLLIYLSEVEAWCPRLSWRKNMKKKTRRRKKAAFRTNYGELLQMLRAVPNTQPLITRIVGMWKYWMDGVDFLRIKTNDIGRNRKEIAVVVGEVIDAKINMTDPLMMNDNLAQWSDLIASLFILGHNLLIITDRVNLLSRLTQGSKTRYRGCREKTHSFDLVYIDIPGMQQLLTTTPDKETRTLIWTKYRCKFRILDPFGTEAPFNYLEYEGEIPGGRPQHGKWNLNLQQFMTKFPLSADNSFLGFAIRSRKLPRSAKKHKSVALIYGTHSHMLGGKLKLLKSIHKYLPLQASMAQPIGEIHHVPKFVANFGLLNRTTLRKSLRKAKLLVGLGHPFEEILPLEGIACGTIFLNPKFNTPKDRQNTDYLKDKTSSRKLTSQHPYIEKYIGEPYAYTVHISNRTQVQGAIKKLLNSKPIEAYIPFEFTCEGMLKRINFYVEEQEFCDESMISPLDTFHIKVGEPGESCVDLCSKTGLVCEPRYFPALNDMNVTSSECLQTLKKAIRFAPAVDVSGPTCIIQKESLLFSCVGESPSHKRICPCREHRGLTDGLTKR